MEAANTLRDYGITIAGAGPEAAWVKEYVRHNTLANVEQLGWVGGEEWQAVLESARVVVVPSIFYENCSLSILEALSYGRIVVATNRGGNPELVIDGVTGFLARPEDSADLARVIKKAMALSPEEAAEMGDQARQLVLKNHRLDDYLDKLEQVYREVIRPR